MPNLTELVVSEGELPNGARVTPVDLEDVRVFDHGFPILRLREVLVASFQVPGLLGFGRPRAPGHGDQEGKENNDPAP